MHAVVETPVNLYLEILLKREKEEILGHLNVLACSL